MFRSRLFWTLVFLFSVLLLNGAEKIAVSAGLPPVAYIVRAVGGDLVTVNSMLPEGRSPHDHAPGPRELRRAVKSKVFFTTNMLYEQRITRALKGKVRTVDISKNIRRIPLESGKHDHHHCGLDHHSCGGDSESGDPHVWLSPVNCGVIASAAAAELSRIAPVHKAVFQKNAEQFSQKMRKLHESMLKKFAPYKGRSFFVYHPAFGYFAQLYHLHQHAIELGGREATPGRMSAVIKKAAASGVKVIFVQKQFNPASARALASAIKGEVMELDPLAADVEKNFNMICEAMLKGFSRGK